MENISFGRIVENQAAEACVDVPCSSPDSTSFEEKPHHPAERK